MNPTKLLQFFDARKEREEPLVLVTVFETEGSTYSKSGAQMLVDPGCTVVAGADVDARL